MRRSIAAAALALAASGAFAQGKEIKIGVIFDITGPFAAGGSAAANYGTKYAIDMINERGGVEGYKIVPIYADAQSKAEVAINEAELKITLPDGTTIRLYSGENYDRMRGLYFDGVVIDFGFKGEIAREERLWRSSLQISEQTPTKPLRIPYIIGKKPR